MRDVIYMDCHATTPVDPRVLEEMLPFFSERFGNPSSHSHRAGLDAEMAVEEAREKIGRAIGVGSDEIYFTSGATESNNLVLRGVWEAIGLDKEHLVISSTEHKCVMDAARALQSRGARLSVLPVDAEGRVDPRELERRLDTKTALVSVIWANNEIGSVNDISAMARICRERGVLFHTDAAQALGKLPIDLSQVPVDFLTGSSHKFYGPKGSGFLFIRKRKPRIRLVPQILGGGQEGGLRSGTLNVPGIVGMARALELCALDYERDLKWTWRLRNLLWESLRAHLGERLVLNGVAIEALPPENGQSALELGKALRRLPGNLNFAVRDLDRDRFFKKTRELAVSFGAACASGDLSLSHVLLAIGLPQNLVQTSIRAGLGRFNTADEVERAAAIIADAVETSLLGLES